jgi:pilus assembly protein CpaE
MPVLEQSSSIPGALSLSIALIDPDAHRRKEIVEALEAFQGATIREYASFPADLEDLPQMLEQRYEAVMVGLDSDPEHAFDVVESLCASGMATVMVYSAQTDLELAIRFMRAGAREFLTIPLLHADLAGALARVSICRSAAPQVRRTPRRLFAFLGTKGGCGVTTVASNFAVALAQESGHRTLLIDLGLPLGDAALNLGMIPEYSTANALQNAARLDANFLRSLLAKHSSGLQVLAAPSEFSPTPVTTEAIDKLLTVARQSFDYVVVDAGSRTDLRSTSLFEDAACVYLIAQVGVTELRNANRMVTQLFSAHDRKLQIVLNRYTPHALLFDEKQIAKALTRPAPWKIPDDYASARRTCNTTTPVALEDTPISRIIRQMARTACGLPANPERKRGFSLFRWHKDEWSCPQPQPEEAQVG